VKVPPLKKGTLAAVEVVPQLAMNGAVLALVLVKQRYVVSPGQVVRAVAGAEVRLADELWDPEHPDRSSVRYPADVCLDKPGTDVVVSGAAMGLGDVTQTELLASVRVGELSRAVRAVGPRRWVRAMGELRLGDPIPFRAVPVRWELAWGGADFTDPRNPVEEPRNPVGRGVVRDLDTLDGEPGPQIEDPMEPITTPTEPYRPAGFGPLGRHWSPRRQHVGTVDDAWLRERMPLWPADTDARLHQCAVPELTAPAHLRGGEAVEVVNMCATGPLRFSLPRPHYFVGMRLDGALREFPSVLDTVLLEPDLRRFEMTWRAVLPMPARLSRVDYIQVHEKTERRRA
jgi:hypothetical protein